MNLQPAIIDHPAMQSDPEDAGLGAPGIRHRLAALTGRVPPALLLLLSVVSVQLGSAVAALLFIDVGPIGTAFTTVGFSAITLLVVSPPRVDRRIFRHAKLIAFYGASLAGMILPFYLAMQTVPLGVATTIAFLGPLMLAVVTSHRVMHFVWIGVALLGLVLLTPDIGVDLDPMGLGLAALSAFGWAGFVMASKSAGQIFDRFSGLTFGLIVATLLLAPLAWREGTVFHAGLMPLAGSFVAGLLVTALPMMLEFLALKRVSPRTYGILVTLDPAIGALVGAIFLGQALGGRVLLAVACVTVAALGVTLFEKHDDQ